MHPGWGEAARSPLLVEQLTYSGVAGLDRGAKPLDWRSIAASLIRATESEIPVVPHGGPLRCARGRAHGFIASDSRSESGRSTSRLTSEAGFAHAGRLRDGDASVAATGALCSGTRGRGRSEIEVPVVVDANGHAVALGDRDVTVRQARRHLVVRRRRRRCRMRFGPSSRSVRWSLPAPWGGSGSRRSVSPGLDGRPYLPQLRPGCSPGMAATETAYGVDLVDLQMRLATRDGIRWSSADIVVQGAAIWTSLTAAGEGSSESIGKTRTCRPRGGARGGGGMWPHRLRASLRGRPTGRRLSFDFAPGSTQPGGRRPS